jgi:seryl-tRNA synthetase
MAFQKRAVPSRYRPKSAQKQAIKSLLVGFACAAGLVMVTMAQITVDRMTSDVYPEQTVASSTLLGP